MAHFMVPDRSVPVRWRGALDGLLPDDHLARFVWDVLCDLDLSELENQYPSDSGSGYTYHPRVMVALWIFGMCQGLETAVGIAEACRIREDFQWLAGGLGPCDQTLLNFLTRFEDKLSPLWVQVLQAMQQAGLVDQSVLLEDGTRMRANASPRSFRAIDKIGALIDELQERLDTRLREVAERTDEETDRKAAAELAGLRSRLARARRAETEVKERIARRQTRQPKGARHSGADEHGVQRAARRFGKAEFRHDAERDVLVCPAGEELRFIGEYSPGMGGGSSYRLYGRRDCRDCPLVAQCTQARGRRVKLPVEPPRDIEASCSPDEPRDGDDNSGGRNKTDKGGEQRDSTASLTGPEAAWMRATSRKRWEPSFNADITVTQDGVIVSQFLTNDCTDYHHFAPALAFVITTLGKPEGWVGDGHYGTEANLVLADREGIELYAPRPGVPDNSADPVSGDPPQKSSPGGRRSERFGKADFRPHPDRDAVLCPADEELRFIGEYPTDNGRGTYRLFGRRDCTGCTLKEQCTRGRGRRVKLLGSTVAPGDEARPGPQNNGVDEPQPDEVARVIRAHGKRMERTGDEMIKLRGHASESANAHLKQHGLGRFHVRGMARCATVLPLACIAHNHSNRVFASSSGASSRSAATRCQSSSNASGRVRQFRGVFSSDGSFRAFRYFAAVSRCMPERSAARPAFPCFPCSSISFLTCASVVCNGATLHSPKGLGEATCGALSDVEV